MIASELKSRFYANQRICQTVPIFYQNECLIAFFSVLKDIKEEYPNVTLSELYDADE